MKVKTNLKAGSNIQVAAGGTHAHVNYPSANSL